MPVGGNSREVELRTNADDALSRTEAALAQVGKVKDVNRSERRVKGSIRYGLQKVLVKAHVQAKGDVSTASLKAQGDDVWGAGAKKVLQKWADAIGR